MRTILTPCIKDCQLHPTTSICKGCGRSLKQIQEWRSYTDDERASIMTSIKTKRDNINGLEPDYFSYFRTCERR